MKSRVSAARAARSFSELMNRACDRGESFIVERRGKPICEIVPAKPARLSGAELAELLRSLPKPDDEYLAIVEEIIARQPAVASP
jgi:antitoxin (DNA-binding transcriptional repressor) of toxin-antitoxin stability system